jgi:hypothetical protein
MDLFAVAPFLAEEPLREYGSKLVITELVTLFLLCHWDSDYERKRLMTFKRFKIYN